MSVEERLLDRAITYFWYAEKFGWTIDEVDRQPTILLQRMLVVGRVRDELRGSGSG
jgi:cytochrome bd-type quinol oxidase subunit 1